MVNSTQQDFLENLKWNLEESILGLNLNSFSLIIILPYLLFLVICSISICSSWSYVPPQYFTTG